MTTKAQLRAGKMGNWFSTQDIVTKVVTVLEKLDQDIRETEDGKYYCILVKIDGVEKDWHATPGQLKAVFDVLDPDGSLENFIGQKFQITAITGKGYGTKTHVVKYIEDPAAQQRIVSEPTPAPVPAPAAVPVLAPTAVPQPSSEMERFLTGLKGLQGCSSEDELEFFATSVCLGNEEKGKFLIKMLKASGRVAFVNGKWVVT